MQFLIDNWQLIAGTIGTAIAYVFGNKRRKSDDKQAEASAMEVMQRTYDTFVADSKAQYDSLKEQFGELKEKLKVVEERERAGLKDRAMLDGKLEIMGKQVAAYEQTISQLKKQISDLEAELSHYKSKTVAS